MSSSSSNRSSSDAASAAPKIIDVPRLRRKSGRFAPWPKAIFAGLLHNLLVVLAFPPFNLWLLICLSLLPIIVLAERTDRPVRAALGTLLGGWVVWLLPYFWLIDVTALGYPLLAGYQALYPAIFVLIWNALRGPAARRRLEARRVSNSRRSTDDNTNSADRAGTPPEAADALDREQTAHARDWRWRLAAIPGVVLVPVIWVGLEFFRGALFGGGYAWFLLGHPAINAIVLCQIADVVGTYGVSFLIAATSGFAGDVLTRPVMENFKFSRSLRFSAGTLAALYFVAIFYGLIRLAETPSVDDAMSIGSSTSASAVGANETDDRPPPPIMTVAAVQTNLPQSNKMGWSIDDQIRDFAEFIRLTRIGTEPFLSGEHLTRGDSDTPRPPAWARDARPPDLICWPETMVPGAGLNPEVQSAILDVETRERITTTLRSGVSGTVFHEALLQLTERLQTPLLVGSLAAPEIEINLERWVDEETGQRMVRIEHDPKVRHNSTFLYLPRPIAGVARTNSTDESAGSTRSDQTSSSQNNSGSDVDRTSDPMSAQTPLLRAVQHNGRYDKLVLTPFGEIMPFVHRWPSLQQRLLDLGAAGMSFDLSPGLDAVRFPVPPRSVWDSDLPSSDGVHSTRGTAPSAGEIAGSLADAPVFRVATPICFESTVSHLCRRLVWSRGEGKVADVLINVTNDGWFGDSIGGRRQHLQVGRFRTIENRVPMIRAANTGISAAIDSAGRLTHFGPNIGPDGSFTDPPAAAISSGVLLASVAIDSRTTLYGRIGDAFGALCLAGLVASIGLWLVGAVTHPTRAGDANHDTDVDATADHKGDR